jgi:hypothetical protein
MRTESGAMTPKAAALVLVAATVLVGAVGYVVLSVVAGESTATTNSGGCTPAASSECAGHAHASAGPGELIAYARAP